MENLTDEQRYLLYNLYSLVLHARNTFYKYNQVFAEKALEGDVQAASFLLSNNLFLDSAKEVLGSDEVKEMENEIATKMEQYVNLAMDEDREVN